MNIKAFRYIIVWVIITAFFACGTTKKVNSAANFAPTEKALLWKIEKENYKTSFLFGTIHIIPSDDFFYPDGTLQSIEESNQMVFEIDMNLMTDMSAQMSLMSKAVMKDGTTLKDLVTEKEYAMIKAHFDKMGLPLALFERMKPAFLSVFASEDMSPTSMQDGSMKSYEMEFVEIANSKNMGIGGLETIDYQLSVFDSIPYQDQAKMLVSSIESSSSGEDELKQIIELYKDQNLVKMGDAFSDETLGDMDILLNNRNRNWIPVMIEYMEGKPTFFAVGAGHLVGEKGVISLLRQKGFKVTPLSEVKE